MAETLTGILNNYVTHDELTKDKLLGASFIVVNKDGILYQGSAGRTRLPLDSPPFRTNSIAWLASMTKLVTTTCLMQLVERGHLTLDEDLRPRVPELGELPILQGFSGPEDEGGEPILVPNTKPITIRHLLTHTSGLGIDIADPSLQRWSRATGRTASLGDCTLAGFTAPLKFPPGEGWYYGTGPDWAGIVLERVAPGAVRRTLGAYMREEVWERLGLEGGEVGFRRGEVFGGVDPEVVGDEEVVEGEDLARYVPVAERSEETGEFKRGRAPFPAEPPVESGGAGLYASAAAYAKVMRSLLRSLAGEEGEGVVLKRETAREMFTPQLDERQRELLREIVFMYGSAAELPDDTPVDVGIGGLMNTADVEGKRRKGSLMWSGMGNSRWWIDPETGIGGVLIVNVIPYWDKIVLKMYDELERAVYGELLS